ncbi:hypothetical protein AA0X95_03585 [Bacillus sp. 1P10SD]|uniref:hypothetical protein n=1 Tax=Bacillus sp. 1P10SD TaxID=3132265 RepID=UPI0039A771E3
MKFADKVVQFADKYEKIADKTDSLINKVPFYTLFVSESEFERINNNILYENSLFLLFIR